MLFDVLINFALNHLPKERWNSFSSLCAALSLPTIGSPISFVHRAFTLTEYPPGAMTPAQQEKFVAFCYPPDLPDRQLQIDCDRRHYWDNASTFIVTRATGEIEGCVQVIHRDRARRLPVEYGSIRTTDGSYAQLNLANVYDAGAMTEIYRCRRSFSLSRLESMNVILMLFKAILAHVIESGAAYSFISFDTARTDLRHLYTNKCDFIDSGTDLFFDSDVRPWRLLRKDWFRHEHTYASKGKTQFFIQTWCRQGLRHKHLCHHRDTAAYLHDCNLIDSGNIVLAQVITPPKRVLIV